MTTRFWVQIILVAIVVSTVCLLAIGIRVRADTNQADTANTPTPPPLYPSVSGAESQEKITNVVGAKIESHPTEYNLMHVIVLTQPDLQLADSYQVISVRAEPRNIVVHTNNSTPSEVLVDLSGDSCTDGSCMADRVQILLTSLSELH